MENEFWVSEITNYVEKAATSKTIECEYDVSKKIYFKVYSPDKFYNVYMHQIKPKLM
jgi:hypothetical protein